MYQILYATKVALLLILFLSCQPKEQTAESINAKTTESSNGDKIPKNGVELIDLLMEKATIRASLSTEDQLNVRKIFEASFIAQHGDLNIQITPENYLPFRKALFFGSRDSLKKYMKGEKSIE